MPIVRAIAVLVPSGLFASLSFHIQQTYTAITPECVEVGVHPTFVDCWKEVLVRIPLHLLGSMCIVALLYMTQPLLRFRVRLLVVVLLVCYFLVQEFYIHPFEYEQPLFKSVIDFFSWVTPLAVYILLDYRHVLLKKY